MDAPPLIVIFGAAVRADGSPSAALLRRIGCGLEAARVWPDAPVVCSGGVGRVGPSEASVMIEILRREGMSADRLIPDEESLDTLQSVAVAARRARALGSPFVVACSDGYHLPRIRLMLAVLGVRSVPGPRGGARGDPWHRLGMGLREIPAIPYDVVLVAAQKRRLLS
ncbi:YdcF family protein [Phenylobacterium sp.]|uniref:YdcF family protein n=1 Tax=Phenylobacterium sp. TaxID=1871053 RepID=UPI002EDAFC02